MARFPSRVVGNKSTSVAIVLRGDGFPHLDLITAKLVEDLEAALEQFRLVAEDLGLAG